MNNSNALADVRLCGGQVNLTNQPKNGLPPFSVRIPQNNPGLAELVRKEFPHLTIYED